MAANLIYVHIIDSIKCLDLGENISNLMCQYIYISNKNFNESDIWWEP